MPTLTREEINVLAGLRRLLVSYAARYSPPATTRQPADLSLIFKELKLMSDTFETEMTKLRGDVAAQSTIIASATEAFRGLVAQLVTAEAAAKNAGATDAQVAAVTNLRVQLETNTASLASAIPANTEMSTTAPVAAPTQVVDPAASAPANSSVVAAAPSTPSQTAVPSAADAATLAANQAR